MSLLRTVDGSPIYRTPDRRFEQLPGYDFAPRYVPIEDSRLGPLRMHYIDESAPQPRATILLLHGEPSWSYLYRKMIPGLVTAGFRVIAPDLIGFGRSDKPGRIDDYSYAGHVAWMHAFQTQLELQRVTLFCQDWGGLIGLRTVAEAPERFARVVISNTALPDGSGTLPDAFRRWQQFARWSPWFPIGKIVAKASVSTLSAGEVAAFDAPFPSRRYKAAARAFPLLVPTVPDDPGAVANRKAWHVLESFDKPVLTLFSDRDPITRGGHAEFERRIPGASGQPHAIVSGGGHFLQHDVADTLVEHIVRFHESTLAGS